MLVNPDIELDRSELSDRHWEYGILSYGLCKLRRLNATLSKVVIPTPAFELSDWIDNDI